MTILWGRVLATLAAIVVLIVVIKYWHPIVGFLTSVEHIGPSYTEEEWTKGMVAFGLICVLVVGLVKVLTTPKGR